tara:strand:- start:3188 stop:3709 length:522 start_codon:yes stop_codon:yes gene_type:complete
MACDINNGRDRACKDGLGGNSTLYLYNELADAFTVLNGEATAMNVLLTEAWAFPLEGDGNTLEQSMVSDRNTGTKVNTQTLTVMLKVMDAATNAQFNLMAAGYPQAVVVDRNGNHHAIGLDDGIDFTVLASTGGAKTDMNGYTLTGVATTQNLSPILDDSTVTAFEAIVQANT